MRKTVMFIAATMIAVSSCGSDQKPGSGATTAATTPAETVAGGGATPTTFAPVPVEEHKCLYRSRSLLVAGVLSVPPEAFGMTLMSDGDLLTLENIDNDKHGNLTSSGLSVYDVGTQDPLQVAATIMANTTGVLAAPVLLTTTAGHWTFAPGSDPKPATVAPTGPTGSLSATAPVVAVVDTGYSETSETPTWLTDRVDPLDAALDNDVAIGRNLGHGKFVASIIVEQLLDVHVLVAAMQTFTREMFYGGDAELAGNVDVWNDLDANHKVEDGFTSDELQLFDAVERLVKTDNEFAALNLSVGSYQCDALETSGLAIMSALHNWAQHKRSPVIAAAGNHSASQSGPVSGFIPGQLDPLQLPSQYATPPVSLTGVQSVQPNGRALSSFSNAAPTSAIGEGLLGVRVDSEVGTYWCGSSFATALVTANIVANKDPEKDPTMAVDSTQC